MPSTERPPTILELCVGNLGMVKGAQVVSFIGAWAFVMHKHADRWDGLTITERVELYRDVSGCSDAAAWRRLRRYRQVFDLAPDPTKVVRLYGLDVRSKAAASNALLIGQAVPVT